MIPQCKLEYHLKRYSVLNGISFGWHASDLLEKTRQKKPSYTELGIVSRIQPAHLIGADR